MTFKQRRQKIERRILLFKIAVIVLVNLFVLIVCTINTDRSSDKDPTDNESSDDGKSSD